jgi:predicted nucleotidyltransferase
MTAAAKSATDDIVQTLSAALIPRAEVLEAYLFGSLTRGHAQAHSDVDVAVFVQPAVLDRPGFGYAAELGAIHRAWIAAGRFGR